MAAVHKRFYRSAIKSHIRESHNIGSEPIGMHEYLGVKFTALQTYLAIK